MAVSWVVVLAVLAAGVLGFAAVVGVVVYLLVRRRKPARGFEVLPGKESA